MKYQNFSEMIGKNGKQFRDLPALSEIREDDSLSTLTFGMLEERILQKAEEMKQSDCVCAAVCGAPSIAWVVDVFGCAIAGKRVVLLDLSQPKELIQKQIAMTNVDTLLPVDPLTYSLCEKQKSGAIEEGGNILFFTSGTTSSAKAVVLSQKALCAAGWNGQEMLPCGREDVILDLLPLNHVFGFVCCLLWPLCYGAQTVLGRGMRYFARDPNAAHATILPVVSSLLKYLLMTDGLNRELKTVLVGAGPCSGETLEAVQAKGIQVSFGYGLTETASGLAISVGAKDPFAMSLCPDTKIAVAEDGEVLVRTESMMNGYWHNPESTDEVLKNGVLHTGDIGSLDEEGKLHIRGRKNDVLVLDNGEKIFCGEWEEQLEKLLGQEAGLLIHNGKLVLVTDGKKEKTEIEKITDAFNREQPISRRIAKIAVLDQKLPRSATGKLQRWKLEELL